MALLKNKRLARKIKDDDDGRESCLTAKERFSSIFSPIKDLERRRLIFCVCILGSNLIGLTVAAFIQNMMLQIVVTCLILILDLLACIVFGLFVKRRGVTYIQVLSIFLSILCIVSCAEAGITVLTSSTTASLNAQISEIKKTSDLILSTDQTDVYLNRKDMTVYSVSDTFGSKYINKSYASVAENSEYYFLYNVGMEIKPEAEELSDVYLYPPTPHTITGYDYLLEFAVNNVRYVSRVFIPGIVNFNHNISSHILDISYGDQISTVYEVNKVDEYLLFQSDYSSFSTPFENVKYSENEYFYVRYNRYMRSYLEIDEVDEIEEDNVRFINSVMVVSPTIHKVNFFWIGEVIDETFTATTPVIEIVYENDTSDIAIVKDINAGAIKTILGYN